MQFFIHFKLSHTKQGFPFTFPLNPIQGGPELTIQGGGQKRLRYIFWPYLLNGSLDLYENLVGGQVLSYEHKFEIS